MPRTDGTVQLNPQIRYDITAITPAMAKEMLTKYNGHNRNLRDRSVDAYAADMLAGAWRETGDSIKRAEDGTIIDGQHRLAAIVKANMTIEMLVVSGLPMEVQENIDAQTKRTFGDVLKLRGETNWIALAAICRRVCLWEMGLRRSNGTATATTTRQLLDALDRHPDLRASATVAIKVRAGLPIPGSVIGLCHWLFNSIDVFDCAAFFDRLHDGANLSTDNPIYVLRRTYADQQTAKSRLTDDTVSAYMIKAWNAYRDGKPIGMLRFRPGGANPEAFPEPH